MTLTEDRLRRELPELADALTGRVAHGPSTARSDPTSTGGGRRWLRIAAAAVCVGLLAGGLALIARNRTEIDENASSAVPAPLDPGVWQPLPAVPIESRFYAVSAWTNDEAVFWAGSSEERNFAYADAAAFDPASAQWRAVAVPGWGHPGLNGVWFDGAIYATAKGGGTRFDPVEGTWSDLPPIAEMTLARMVATDDGIWGVGPVDGSGTDLAIARYEPRDDMWTPGPVFEGSDADRPAIEGLVALDTDLIWTGDEILAWRTISGMAFEPGSATWRSMGRSQFQDVAFEAGRAVATEGGVAITLAGFSVLSPDRFTGIGRLDEQGLDEATVPLPVDDLSSVSLVSAGEWAVAFAEGATPVGYHVASGRSLTLDGAPSLGRFPNTVWTGSELIVWDAVSGDAWSWLPSTS